MAIAVGTEIRHSRGALVPLTTRDGVDDKSDKNESTATMMGSRNGKDEGFPLPSRYRYYRTLGNGASAIDMTTGAPVAVKRITKMDSLLIAKRTLRELKLLRHFQGHPNIVQLIDVFDTDGPSTLGMHQRFEKLFIVQELMDVDLCGVFCNRFPLTRDLIKSIMFQLLMGVEAMHSADVLHRDLKPGNLLFRHSTGELKICDFGLARGLAEGSNPHCKTMLDLAMTNYVATRWYRAPELLLQFASYGKPIDMWSVGCIFAELLGRKVFLPGQSSPDQIELIVRKLGMPSEEDIESLPKSSSRTFLRRLERSPRYPLKSRFPDADSLAIDLLERLLVFNPAMRLTASEALRHEYFADAPHVPNRLFPRFDCEFDGRCFEINQVKTLILEEVAYYRTPQAVEAKAAVDLSVQKLPSLMQRLGLRRPLAHHSKRSA